ncbi:hypothetical protein TWF481_004966 [Arthrobotrys musiformis]|uniref:Uncharacterized protein n=1 Tax=Arthrobotrys musiformis TaxID=47236 RepID=A0AAV9WN38_9PEZI
MDFPQYYPYYHSTNLLPLGSLPSEDCSVAVAAIRALLGSSRAQHILSRIVAGPEPEPPRPEWHTKLTEPPNVPEEVVSKYLEELRDSFVLESLPVDSRTLQEYQRANNNEVYKSYRLLEIVCTALHFVAMQLYHKHHPRQPYYGNGLAPMYPKIIHPKYFKYEKTGHINAVGFWAEAQILGGVVIFDRGASGGECKSVWLHGKPNSHQNEAYELPSEAVFGILKQEHPLPLDLA